MLKKSEVTKFATLSNAIRRAQQRIRVNFRKKLKWRVCGPGSGIFDKSGRLCGPGYAIFSRSSSSDQSLQILPQLN